MFCLLQITGNFKWAQGMVATMQQACVDGELMRNYTDVNDTKTLVNITNESVGNITSYRCEPYDCNGNGRCDKGSCVCNRGTTNENETEAGFSRAPY